MRECDGDKTVFEEIADGQDLITVHNFKVACLTAYTWVVLTLKGLTNSRKEKKKTR